MPMWWRWWCKNCKLLHPEGVPCEIEEKSGKRVAGGGAIGTGHKAREIRLILSPLNGVDAGNDVFVNARNRIDLVVEQKPREPGYLYHFHNFEMA